MRDTHYKRFNVSNSFFDLGASLRYLKGKDQRQNQEDDPDFFTEGGGFNDTVSRLSSSLRIFRKVYRKQKKEVH